MANSRTFVFLIALLVLAGAVFYVGRDAGIMWPGNNASTTPMTSNTQKPGDIIPIDGGTIEVLSSDDVPPPQLGKPVVFTVRYAPEVEKMMRDTILKLEGEIQASDAPDFTTWNNLAMYRKQTGDYAAALDIWGYLTYRYSQDPVPFLNRANLYAYFIKDFPKAEADYKRAVANTPSDYQAHYQLVLFYRDVLKDMAKAKAAAAEAKKNLSPQAYSDIEKLAK